MKVEKEIVSYLHEYGNTKEIDVINYGVKKFNYSSKRMKKTIRRMVIQGQVHYVVHNKLEPPAAYICLKEPLPPETAKILLEALIQVKTTEEDARKILEDAAVIANRKAKEKHL